jgi:hypothetical protein
LASPLAPVILFVYNRPWHTRQTVEALQKNPLAQESSLYIFADGAKDSHDAAQVQQVRNYIRTIFGFQDIHITESPRNKGLADSVIEGVSQIINSNGRAIVMEDDMICAGNFLQFMNDALNTYSLHPQIFSISGYSYPIPVPATYQADVYLLPRASSWGWATWADRWNKTDWKVSDYTQFIRDKHAKKAFAQGGEDLVYMLMKQQKGFINSWAVRWSYAHYKHEAYCLFLVKSKINNIGTDNSGTHSPNTNKYATQVSNAPYLLPLQIQPDSRIVAALQRFFKPSLLRKLINYVILRQVH